MTGLLDLTSPFLSTLDQPLAALLPAAGRLAVWGLVAASLSMALYALLSPQRRLRGVKAAAAEARQALDDHEGGVAEAMPLIGRMFRSALAQLGLVLGPAVLASLPVLFMIVWLSGTYGHFLPDSITAVDLRVEPSGLAARWLPEEGGEVGNPPSTAPRIQVIDAADQVIETVEIDAAVTSLHKRQWWNSLIANPLGYLPAEGVLERIDIDLPRQEVLSLGSDWLPGWMRGWEAVFFAALLAASLAIKFIFRLV
ncbi:hypothetical protein HBA54_02410 [Pelagibius litoralis]|uniref:Uncharacterized protein n=1 Tax=Pelagibius litoralis TaxID=374515 RepID=A0A967C2Z0_9PROT|nr:hypothetical protein [Pelagibius litoralis]NIA67435.1 hypothetical protein [Pelagibius litoralis]